jgi:hypothetical protein
MYACGQGFRAVTRKWKNREQIHVTSYQGETIRSDLLWRIWTEGEYQVVQRT